ncbi:hypothetical protein GA0115246_110351, partial [Streptomyces sp. SolWspMP-sol7th]
LIGEGWSGSRTYVPRGPRRRAGRPAGGATHRVGWRSGRSVAGAGSALRNGRGRTVAGRGIADQAQHCRFPGVGATSGAGWRCAHGRGIAEAARRSRMGVTPRGRAPSRSGPGIAGGVPWRAGASGEVTLMGTASRELRATSRGLGAASRVRACRLGRVQRYEAGRPRGLGATSQGLSTASRTRLNIVGCPQGWASRLRRAGAHGRGDAERTWRRRAGHIAKQARHRSRPAEVSGPTGRMALTDDIAGAGRAVAGIEQRIADQAQHRWPPLGLGGLVGSHSRIRHRGGWPRPRRGGRSIARAAVPSRTGAALRGRAASRKRGSIAGAARHRGSGSASREPPGDAEAARQRGSSSASRKRPGNAGAARRREGRPRTTEATPPRATDAEAGRSWRVVGARGPPCAPRGWAGPRAPGGSVT